MHQTKKEMYELTSDFAETRSNGVPFARILLDKLTSLSEKIAMIDQQTEETLTYGQLLSRSVATLKLFKERYGIKKGDVVGLMAENRIEYFVPVLAAVFGGFVIHHFNYQFTAYELKHLMELSQPKLIICTEKSLETVKQIGFVKRVLLVRDGVEEETPCLSDLIKDVAVDLTESFIEDVGGETILSIMNSSGTTGLPKGVMHSHDNWRRLFLNTNVIDMKIRESYLGVLPNSHIFGTFLFFFALNVGSRVINIRKFKPEAFLASIEKYRVRTLFVVPQLAVFMLKTKLDIDYDLTTLRKIYTGASSLSSDLMLQIEEKFKIEMHQVYGLTETSGLVTLNPMGFRSKRYKSIGRVMPTMKVKIINETGDSLPHGQTGEICFAGELIAKGYVNNVKVTKETIDPEGFLHTGDTGYIESDGYIYLIDRMKELIKYKGYQVSPSEIECVLNTHRAVKDSGVIGVSDIDGGEVPLAFVVKQEGVDVNELELCEFVAEILSPQKYLRGGVKFIDEIPKNPSGKILRFQLKKLIED